MAANKPSAYRCRKCGSLGMGPTDSPVLMQKDRATGQEHELLCSCGGSYGRHGPLFLYEIPPAVFNSGKILKITCKACSAPFRKRGPSRYACTSCTAFALVQEHQLWLLDDRVAIAYE